jgi:hypothetical protein
MKQRYLSAATAIFIIVCVGCRSSVLPPQKGGASKPLTIPYPAPRDTVSLPPEAKLALGETLLGAFARFRAESAAAPGSTVIYGGRRIAIITHVLFYAPSGAAICSTFDAETDSLTTGMARIAVNPDSVMVLVAPTLNPEVAFSGNSLEHLVGYWSRDRGIRAASIVTLGNWPARGVPRPPTYLALGKSVILPVFSTTELSEYCDSSAHNNGSGDCRDQPPCR